MTKILDIIFGNKFFWFINLLTALYSYFYSFVGYIFIKKEINQIFVSVWSVFFIAYILSLIIYHKIRK